MRRLFLFIGLTVILSFATSTRVSAQYGICGAVPPETCPSDSSIGAGGTCDQTTQCDAGCRADFPYPVTGTCRNRTECFCGTCYCTNISPTGRCGNWKNCHYYSSMGDYYEDRWCDLAPNVCDPSTGQNCDYQIRRCDPTTNYPTSPPGGPTYTPAPTSTTAPTPPIIVTRGNVVIRGAVVPRGTTDCATIATSPILENDITFMTVPSLYPSSQTQTTTQVRWDNVPADTNYVVLGTSISGGYVMGTVCHNSGTEPAYALNNNGHLYPNDTLTFYVGFSSPGGWVRTQEGNVYAQTTVQSLLPDLTTNKMFNLPGSGGYPGIVSMGGSTFDFAMDSADTGAANVSKNGAGSDVNWLVTGQTFSSAPVDLYSQFLRRVNTQNISTYTGPANLTTTGLYQTGSLSITSPVNVPTGTKVVVMVNGDLSIQAPITITGSGFIAFIVNGTISVANSVGNADRLDFTTMNVQGVYVAATTAHTGLFQTQSTGNTATERRLNLKGIFIADNFTLSRDLGTDNAQRPAEYFIFDPQLLFTMPDYLRDLPYTWQEVAP